MSTDGDQIYRQLYESLHDGIVSVDTEGLIVSANQAYQDMVGYTIEELRKLTDMQLTPEKWHAAELEIIRTQVEARGYSDEYEKEYIRKDGSVFPISLRMWIIADESGKPAGMWAIVRDITESKVHEWQIADAHRNWEKSFQAIGEAMFLVDLDLNVIQHNAAFASLVGRETEDLKGQKCFALVHNLDEPPDFCLTCAAARERKTATAELYEPYLDKYLDASADPTFDRDGNFDFALHIIRDITERKSAQDELEEQFATFKAVIDNLDYPIFSVDTRYRYTSFNKAHAATMKALYGRDIEIGRSLLGYQTVEEDRAKGKENIDRALAGASVVEEAYSGDDALHRRYFEVLHQPITGDSGQVIGVAISARDITERSRMEMALRDSEEKYRTLFENMIEGFAYCEMTYDETGEATDWTYLVTNRAFEELTGLKDVDGKRVTDVIPGIREANPELLDIYGEVASTGVAQEFETRLPSLDLDLAIKVFSPARGYFVAVFENTTERQRAQRALRESEERYREIFENATEGIFQSTPTGDYLSVNPAFARMYGYESPKQMQQEVTEIASQLYADPSDREEIKQLLADQDSIKGKEVKFKRRDGSALWVRLNAHLVKDDSGDVLYFEGTTEDISVRRAAEANLRLAMFELDHAGDMILRVSEEGRILFANDAACRRYGAERDEVLRLSVWDIDPSISEGGWKDRWQSRKEERQTRMEATWRQKDGESYPVGLMLNFMEFEGYEYIVAFGRDITERKKAEEELAAAERRYRELAESLPQVVFELDSSGVVTYANPSALEIFGYTVEDIEQGIGALDIIEEVDRGRVSGAIDKMMDGRSEGAVREYLAKRKDGTTFPAMVYSSLVSDENGEPAGIRGILTDISDIKQFEADLEASERKYRELANSLPEVVFEIDGNGVFTYVNESGAARFGYDVDEIVGKLTPVDIMAPEDSEKAVEVMRQVFREGHIPPTEFTVFKRDGTPFPALIFGNLSTRDGRPFGMSGLVMDISERKQYEEDLQKVNVELEGFAHTVSHDLRGPLTVMGFASELIQQNVGEPQTAEVKTAMVEAARLLGSSVAKSNALIDDLLNLAQAGQAPSGVVEVDLTETVESILDENAAALRRHDMRVVVGDDLGTIRANPTHAYQIFANLIGNAVNHSLERGAVIEVKRLPSDSPGTNRFLVRDNGVGIEPKALDKIFIPFYKGDDGGTGIGLATVQKAVVAYGGWIRAYNDGGACFEFALKDWKED